MELLEVPFLRLCRYSHMDAKSLPDNADPVIHPRNNASKVKTPVSKLIIEP